MRRLSSQFRPWVTLLAALALPFCFAALASAELRKLEMPADYADYALNPETGDLAAVNAESGEAVLFKLADLKADKPKPSAKIRVGSTPCSIFFKRFGETRVFAIVCSRDSHMFLMNAADGALLKKIELAQSGVSFVTGSINPADPFLYYNYGGGHDSLAGAVNLRSMKSHAPVFNDSMDCAISASGAMAYRRGPWSPSGFTSLLRTSALTEEKPVFIQWFSEHESAAQYIPDPFDRFTAAGQDIYTRTLEKKEASLDFVPLAFFRKRPVVVGMKFAGYTEEPQASLELAAASYNTFTNLGDRIKIELAIPQGNADLPRGTEGHADFKRVAKTTRVLADDDRDQVIVASRNRVALVPLAEFDLPAEPFLLATLEGSQSVVLGKENLLNLKLFDPKVKVEFDTLPDGMKADGTKLTWKPAADQVGVEKIAVTLKHGDLQRVLTFEVNVEFPSVTLPFAPSGMAIAPDGRHGVIWDGPAMNHDLYVPRVEGADPRTVQLAAVDLETGKQLATRKLTDTVQQGVMTADHVFLLTVGDPARCEILKAKDLEREKSLLAGSAISRVETFGKLLVLYTERGIELYDLVAFKRVKTPTTRDEQNWRHGAMQIVGSDLLTAEGLLIDDLLFDAELKPQLVLSGGLLPALAGNDPQRLPAFITAAINDQPERRGGHWRHVRENAQLDARPLPGTGRTVNLMARQFQAPNSAYRQMIELALTTESAGGELQARQVLVRTMRIDEGYDDGSIGSGMPTLCVAAGQALVAYQRQLYRWTVPPADDAMPAPLSFAPRQTALALAGTGKTILKHVSRGGRAPFTFELLSPYDAIAIDAKTGDVTIDEAAILPEAMRAVEQQFAATEDGLYVDALRAAATAMTGRAQQILGRKPKGAPVAIPIRVELTDAEGETASLQYYILAELKSTDLIERLKKRDDERMSRPLKNSIEGPIANRPKRSVPRSEKVVENFDDVPQEPAIEPLDQTAEPPAEPKAESPEPAVSNSEVLRRMAALEERLDLITRQLNQVLEQLEKKK